MRWIFRLLGVLLSLAILAVAALFLIPADRVARIATDRFESATGRALSIAGPVRPSIWPVIGARIENVRLDNAAWSDAGPMFEADALDLGLDLQALIGGDIVITRLEAVAPRILLEREADGTTNWDFARRGPATPAAGGAEGRRMSLALAQITNATLQFQDRAAAVDLRFEGVDLELSLPDLAGPGALRATGRRNDQDFAAEARIDGLQRFLDGAVTPLVATLEAGGSRAHFEGRAGIAPLAAEGRLSVEGPGLAPLLALAGQRGAEPLPPAARPFALAGQVTLAPAGSLHLREGVLRLGPNRLTAALDLVQDGPRPRLTGEIAAETLDLTAQTGGGGTGNGAGAEGWSRAPIDASAVGLVDAAVTLRAGVVETGFGRIAPFRAGLTIDRARAVFDLREVGLFGGRLGGEFVINNRSGLSVGGDLRAEEVALLPLLQQVAGFDRLTGTGAASLRFLGAGQSMDAIMRSLSGEGRVDLGRGEIVGLDLAGMLRNLDMSYMGDRNRTIYDTLTGTFAIQGGVLRNDDLRMEASAITVDGRGSVDIGARTLDYRVIPTALRDAETGRAIRVPLQVTGPWDAPRFRLDLEGLAEERLREERARVEERARQEVERRLGIERQEGQSSEDALRERLEEEIGRGLQRLLRPRD
ncbi:AsmA-like C-terminal region-containing protein [Pararhodobacter sp. SW119]|uniref:AsmA family protein n=1 Tax=Pararhodobacter sp. SW119 TaxID=2780075 RepID=UPI001ADFB467|nr:AsmA-like C-terminal region-containing protein [Pararhodobacter sp. SW119]